MKNSIKFNKISSFIIQSLIIHAVEPLFFYDRNYWEFGNCEVRCPSCNEAENVIHFPIHPKPLVQQIGNYTLADLNNLYKKYKHKRTRHILI